MSESKEEFANGVALERKRCERILSLACCRAGNEGKFELAHEIAKIWHEIKGEE